jgi:hypothetical protein
VEVQLAERAGQIQVAVRTQDPALETSLRRDLNTLVDSLERSGFRAEAITTGGAAAQDSSGSRSSQERTAPDWGQHQPGDRGHSGAGSHRDHPRRDQPPSRQHATTFSLSQEDPS